MVKKRIIMKDKKLKDFFKKGGRKGAKKDFLELLKRAAKPTS
ncbi:MAG TPA: hypothetical protein VLF89_00580 [Candidatus Saccharimonadales bacterium]|nr:hypothetical protein [Candidatus Saccharimonadales bacterium]